MQTKQLITCKICGHEYDPSGLFEELRERLLNVNVCYHCDFWMEKVQMRNRDDVARINGYHFLVGDLRSKVKGMSGAKITIRYADGRVVHTDNLWGQGTVPSRFKIVLFDNAEFVK